MGFLKMFNSLIVVFLLIFIAKLLEEMRWGEAILVGLIIIGSLFWGDKDHDIDIEA